MKQLTIALQNKLTINHFFLFYLLQQFQQYQMDSLDPTPNSIRIKDIAQNQYKLYDMELFKSQLKIFKKQPTNKQLQAMKIQDQSLSQDQFLPITHQDAKKRPNALSILDSFDISRDQSEKQQKIDRAKDVIEEEEGVDNEQFVVETWKNRPRRTSNPMFLQNNNKSEQSNNLVQQLEILTKQRAKYQQATYFTKKERSAQAKSIQELFTTYTHPQNQPPKLQKIQINKSNTLDQFLKPKSPLSIPPSPLSTKQDYRPNVAKDKDQPSKFFKSNNYKWMTPQTTKNQYQIEKEEICTEPRIKNANLSPNRLSVSKYLQEEDKNKYKSQHSKQVFKGQVPLKEQYLEQNRLRDQYLKNAKMRSEQIHQQIEKLKQPAFLEKRQSSSRKNIFTLNTPKTIKTQMPKTFEAKNPRNANQKKSPYKNIFSSNIDKDNKKQNQSVDFKYVRQSLVNTRIHIFNTKSRQKEKRQSQEKVKSKRKVSIFKKEQKKFSPLKNQIIYNFNLLQMDLQTHYWFQTHEKDIIQQAEKIYSYELINRYISKSEIEVRMNQFIKGMIEPKRWVLLMVDSVYARLKDRYLPN